MNRSPRKKLPRYVGITILFAGIACGDGSTAPDRRTAPSRPHTEISDGAHGGNDDVFLLPPLASNPSSSAGYGDPFQSGLPVIYRIRDMTTPTHPVIKTLIATASVTDQQY